VPAEPPRRDAAWSRCQTWFTLLAALAVILSLALTFKPVVEGDGVFYFAYLHAIAVQHDLDFRAEYDAAVAERVAYDPLLIRSTNDAGTPSDAYPLGPAVLSFPIWLGAVAAAGPGGAQFGPPYATAYCLASLLAGLLALALAFRLVLSVLGSASAAAVGVAAGALTTPFVYYLTLEPSYSHTFSALVATAFVAWWWRTREGRTAFQWLVLGLIGGVMAMTRFQDGALVAIAAIDVPRTRWRALWLVPGVVAGFAPQLVVDAAQFGSLLPHRPPSQALDALPGHYLDVLLSSHNGLLAWHPGLLAAAAGCALIPDRRLRLAALLAAVLEVLIGGAAPDWYGGFSFGGRRFLVLLPFVVLGYGALAARVDRRVVLGGLALLAAWNVVLMANLTYVIRGPRDPGYLGLLLGQAQALPYVPRELAQGAAARALALWPLVHQPARLGWGLGLLGLEAAAVLLAAAVAGRAWAPPTDLARGPFP
jgi:hypothetical protein